MKKINIYLLYISLLFIAISCKKPYTPSITAAAKNYLVVEGVINNGNDSTFIKLSRTIQLANGAGTNTEKGAFVTINTEGGPSYTLTEIKPGTYGTGPLSLDNTKLYRLKIQTSSGQQYESDEIAVKNAPPIDTIGYKIKNNALQIVVNAHDPGNNTRYYRWDYEETWRFHSKYKSSFISDGKDIVPRTEAEDIYTCFGNKISNTIVITSTSKLSQDVVSELPLTDIPASSQKISMRYSILVRQYALSKQAYGFWENLKKNTEQLGSIFDALPSEIMGNIHNVGNAAEPVIGFIEAGTVTTKRIFIDREQLPEDWVTEYPKGCSLDTALYKNKYGNDEVQQILVPKLALPIYALGDLPIVGFLRSSFECADCTLTGTKKQPDFWK
jgi:hypothetical protein